MKLRGPSLKSEGEQSDIGQTPSSSRSNKGRCVNFGKWWGQQRGRTKALKNHLQCPGFHLMATFFDVFTMSLRPCFYHLLSLAACLGLQKTFWGGSGHIESEKGSCALGQDVLEGPGDTNAGAPCAVFFSGH